MAVEGGWEDELATGAGWDGRTTVAAADWLGCATAEAGG